MHPPDPRAAFEVWWPSAHGTGALERQREAGHPQGRAPATGFQGRALRTQWAERRLSGVS